MRSFTESRILRDILLIVAAVLMLAVASPAEAGHRGNTNSTIVPPPGGCQFVIDNGCAAAPANGNFQISSTVFTSTAIDDGGSSIIATYTPPANRAGVEYPVGLDKTLTLKDPATATLPSGCTYNASGQAVTGGPTGPIVICGANGHDITLHGWDFTGDSSGGIGCIVLRSSGSSDHTLFVDNSKFRFRGGLCALSGAWVKKDNNYGLVLTSNYFDGDYIANPNIAFPLSDNGSSTTDFNEWYYNYFVNVGGRIFGGARGFGHQYFKYNYVDGYGLGTSGAGTHGEVGLMGGLGTANSIKFDPVQYIGNTILYQKAKFPGGQSFSTTFYCETGGTAQFATSCVVDENTIIMNVQGSGAALSTTALFEQQWSGVDTQEINNNVVYPHGAFGCGLVGAPNNQATASTSGNTITVTAKTATWFAGFVISRDSGASFTPAVIQPYGTGGTTGTGGTGTYIFDGPPQSVSSTGSWRVTTPIGSNTSSGNINLVNGESMNGSGSYTWATTCTGHG